jgi:PTH1 family peptidyl-tRNA hydrolase
MFRRKRAESQPADRWLVVGLGNPGREYEGSRHNVGFLVLDELGRRHGVRITDRAARSLVGRFRDGDQEVVLAKPQTWMNRSGDAVKALRAKYRVPLDRTLVVHDELDLPFGRLRLRAGGSSAGNHGLDSVIAALGTTTFPRARVGIGRPVGDGVDYVLSPFTEQERAQLQDLVKRVSDAVKFTVVHGLDRAMTEFNRGQGGESGSSRAP